MTQLVPGTTVRISDLTKFGVAFGSLGLKGGPRTGAHKRTQDDEDWFIARRFLAVALRVNRFPLPVLAQRRNPPDPDFALKSDEDKIIAWLEITEATAEVDQQEMTCFEKSGKRISPLGNFGGRFAGGASHPEIDWVSDVVDALKRKRKKAICTMRDNNRHLVIFPNSNASFLIDEEDELDAFDQLNQAVAGESAALVRSANGCFVHVLSQRFICFDILGERRVQALV